MFCPKAGSALPQKRGNPRHKQRQAHVSVALPWINHMGVDNESRSSSVPEQGQLFITVPVQALHLHFHINGSFEPKDDREAIHVSLNQL